jgi:geranylgeranyl diphosphate synthase type 3
MNSILSFHRLNDIQDKSTLRRGLPVVHSIYGIGNTANVLSYILMIGLEKAINMHPAVSEKHYHNHL